MKTPTTIDGLKIFLDKHDLSGAIINLQLSTDNNLKEFGIKTDITTINIEMVHEDG